MAKCNRENRPRGFGSMAILTWFITRPAVPVVYYTANEENILAGKACIRGMRIPVSLIAMIKLLTDDKCVIIYLT